jgi:predicted dehydrogenase
VTAPAATSAPSAPSAPAATAVRRPRLGFLGVGWIGRNRMEAVAADGSAEIVAVADASADAARDAARGVGAQVADVDEVLRASDLDGLVVATPSALHAEQAMAALEGGMAVFVQKPMGRTAEECADVMAAARRADRLLGVDLSYRHVEAMRVVREHVQSGAIGTVHAVELVFHNGYGPDKAWFRDRAQSGGGCVIDLGVHLLDLLHWVLPEDPVVGVTARLHAGGQPYTARSTSVEDAAEVLLDLASGAVARLSCSWWMPIGADARIVARFTGEAGAVEVDNVDGSFYDFRARLHRGTTSEDLVGPPDAWGGRAIVSWARALAAGSGYDPEVESLLAAADVIDRIYAR